jgi:hypothetical protein
MNKKLTALLAVFLAVFSILPMDAAAADNQHSMEIDTDCTVPDITIEVTVPPSTDAYLNPKRVSVSFGNELENGQIISEPAWIDNQSIVPLAVSVEVTGTVKKKSTLTLSNTTTKGRTDKEAFVYFEMQAVEDPLNVTWAKSYDASKHIIVSEYDVEKENFLVLGAASQDNHYGAFQLAGDCVTDPDDDPWTTTDGFTTKVIFTFKALPFTS